MGKKNPAQRTKGNTKPSNSGRAADLLSSSSSPAYTFGLGAGADAVDDQLGADSPGPIPKAASVAFVGTTPNCDVPSFDFLDGETRFLLKKMTKKDATTKAKALTEFLSVLETKSEEEIKGLAPFWPRLYNALSTDSDRKVRELSQRVLLLLAEPGRRKVAAPHLKALMGAWMLARADEHAPAASAARRAFDAAFESPEKRRAALRACRREILVYLKDILLDQTPETLSDVKSTPKDEMDAKYERVFAAALTALATLISTTTADERVETEDVDASVSTSAEDEDFADLLINKKLVRLSIHSNAAIRAAWYCVVAEFVRRRPEATRRRLAAPLATSVLNRFEESDPRTVSLFWSAALAIVDALGDECWTHVSAKKSVGPKLRELLRAGCGGAASVVCPGISVVVSRLPNEMLVGGAAEKLFAGFHVAVVESLERGARSFQSTGESSALLLCLAECLAELIRRLTKESETETPSTLLVEPVSLLFIAARHKHARHALSTRFVAGLRKAAVANISITTPGEVSARDRIFETTLRAETKRAVDAGDLDSLRAISTAMKRVRGGGAGAKSKKVEFVNSNSHSIDSKSSSDTTVPCPESPAEVIAFSVVVQFEIRSTILSKLRVDFSPSLLALFCDVVEDSTVDSILFSSENDAYECVIPSLEDGSTIGREKKISSVFRLIWLPLWSRLLETSTAAMFTEVARRMARLLKRLVEADAAAAAKRIEETATVVDHPIVYRVFVEAARNEAGIWSSWIAGEAFRDYLMRKLKEALGGGDFGGSGEGGGEFVVFVLESLSLMPETSKVIVETLLLAAVDDEDDDARPTSVGVFAGAIFTGNPTVVHEEAGRALQLRILKSFLTRLWKKAPPMTADPFKRAIEAGFIAWSRLGIDPPMEVTTILRTAILDAEDADDLDKLVDFLGDICSLLASEEDNEKDEGVDGGRKPPKLPIVVCRLMSHVFADDGFSDSAASLFRGIWIPRLLVEGGALWLEEGSFVAIDEATKTTQSARSYLQLLSTFARLIVKLAFDLNAMSSIPRLLTIVSEVVFVSDLLRADVSVLGPVDVASPFLDRLRDSFAEFEAKSLSLGIVDSSEAEKRAAAECLAWAALDSWRDSEKIVDPEIRFFRKTCALRLLVRIDDLLTNGSRRSFVDLLSRVGFVDYFLDFDGSCTLEDFISDEVFLLIRQCDRRVDERLWRERREIVERLHLLVGKGKVVEEAGETKVKNKTREISQLLVRIMRLLNDDDDDDDNRGEISCLRLSVFRNLMTASDDFGEEILACVNVEKESSWSSLQFNVGLIRFFAQFLSSSSYDDLFLLSPIEWEFLFSHAASWLLSATETRDNVTDESLPALSLKSLTFLGAVIDLVAAVSPLFCPKCRPCIVEPSVDVPADESSWLKAVKLGAAPLFPWAKNPTETPESEWTSAFAEQIFASTASCFISFAAASARLSSFSSSSSSVVFAFAELTRFAAVAASFRAALECCVPDEALDAIDVGARLVADDAASATSLRLQSIVNNLVVGLESPFVDVRSTAFHLLSRLMPRVAKEEEEGSQRKEEEEEDTDGAGLSPPASLVAIIDTTQAALDLLVEGLPLGEAFLVDEGDDGATVRGFVLSNLLAWNLLRRLLSAASPALRAQFVVFLGDRLPRFLRLSLFLLPVCLRRDPRRAAAASAGARKAAEAARALPGAVFDVEDREEDAAFVLLNQDPILSPRRNPVIELNSRCRRLPSFHAGLGFYLPRRKSFALVRGGGGGFLGNSTPSPFLRCINALAGATFVGVIRDLPASVRQWYNDADRKTASLAERVCANHVSPVLCARELESVALESSTSTLDEVTVKVRKSSREVVAVYQRDEVVLELLLKLPADFPLGAIVVEGGRRLCDPKDHKRWMLQLTTFLQHQNGGLLDAVAMWKRNIDKPFEGVEPCMICFSVLHGSNYQMPKLTCKACKKKFHSACLYKWFSASVNSSCPMCRSLF